SPRPPRRGVHLTAMCEAMERGEMRALYAVGESPAQGEADQQRAQRLLEGLDHLVVQDLFLTRTAEFADVVLPAAATLGEVEGTVTSSERRVQRVRKAYDPPGEARDDIEIVYDLARSVGGEAILLAPEDGERYGVADGARVRVVSRRGAVEAPARYDSDGARVRVVSRRGAVEAPARYDTTLRPGLAFMNLHFPDEVATNVLTIDATDPKSGTAEFKATAVRLEAVQ